MAQTTKKALADSLKKKMSEKPFDKITITDIVTDCEVNRQTFYYHFKDIYDLVEWTYSSEAAKALGEQKTYDTWQQGFLQIFQYILSNKNFVKNTYHSISREHLERYLYSETYQLLIGVVEEKAANMEVREEDKAFIAHFYKYAFVGIVLQWIEAGMRENPATIVDRISMLIVGDISGALEKLNHKH